MDILWNIFSTIQVDRDCFRSGIVDVHNLQPFVFFSAECLAWKLRFMILKDRLFYDFRPAADRQPNGTAGKDS